MSLLEDAVRVLTGNVSVHLVYDPERGATHICLHCPARVLFSDERPLEHAPDCPTRSMPKIVAALQAAERLTVEPPEADGPWCAVCGAKMREWREEGGQAIKIDLPHEPDCDWQALATALKG